MTMGEIMDMKETEAQETVAKMFCGVAQSDPDTFHADAEEYINANIDQVQYYRCNEGLGVFFPGRRHCARIGRDFRNGDAVRKSMV